MKHLIVILFCIMSCCCFSQFDKSVSLRATGNFEFALNGLATNTNGIGFAFDAAFFSKHRLQALVEVNADRFFGDKFLVIDTATGKEAKRAAVLSIKAGPQFFVTKNIALSATYGPAWHVVREFKYSLDYGFQYSVTGFLGNQRRFIVKVFMVSIPTEELNIQYIGLAAGYRFK